MLEASNGRSHRAASSQLIYLSTAAAYQKAGGNAACVGDICNPRNNSCKRLQDQEIKRKQG